MQLSDLQQLVQDQKRDLTGNFVDTNELNRYFNQCSRFLNSLHNWDFTITSATVAYVAGTSAYTLSAIGNNDFKTPINLFADYNHYFDYVSLEDFNVLKNFNNNVWNNDLTQMYINNSTTVNSLSCTYYSTNMAQTSGGSFAANLSASTDTPLMPERFQDIYVDYALMRIYKKEGLTDDANASQADFEKKIKVLQSEFISRRTRPLKRWKHISERNGGLAQLDRKENPLQQ